jgi:hypothetical protein
MIRNDVLNALKAALQGIGYEDGRVRRNYSFADLSGGGVEVRRVPMAAFADYPHSYQNACVGVVFAPDGQAGGNLLGQYQSLGAPLLLEVVGDRIQAWSNRSDGIQRLGRSFLVADVAEVMTRRRSEWGKASLGVSRRPSSIHSLIQPDFFDRGLMPMLQKQFQQRLRQQLELSYRAIHETYVRVHSREPDVADLFAFLFRFVTAKIFMDRADATGWDHLENDPLKILKAAERHTGLLDKPESDFRRKAILETAWATVSESLQFQNLAAPDLAFVAESAFITPETRKQLGVHSTPSGLAEYIVENLPWEQVPWDKRVVFEPFSGHGILLAKAMERMGHDLPSNWTPAKRHEYFRERLIGVEDQPLSLEICRLVLTLTDYPNGNSWDGLQCSDMFQWEGWDETMQSATVVLSNPPYEKFTKAYREKINATKTKPPAEMMHRIMKQPPALLGLVLPRSFLTDPVYRDANREIAKRYGEVKIVELPPIFRYADNDTIALMTSSLRQAGTTVSLHHSEVPKGREEQFLEDFHVSEARQSNVTIPKDSDKTPFSLRLLPEDSVTAELKATSKLGDVSEIHKGVNWITRTDGKKQSAPRTDVAHEIGGKQRKGYHKGAEKMQGNLGQFQLRRIRMLSLRDEDQDPSTRANRRSWGNMKVAFNAARFQPGSPWRIAAFCDLEGLAFTKQYFCAWPKPGVSVAALAAILNSQVANLWAYERDRGRDNRVETINDLPLPLIHHLLEGSQLDRLATNLQAMLEMKPEFFNEAHQPTEAEVTQAVLRLDAAVLDAYELTAAQQQRLLRLFDGWNRPLPPPFDKCFIRYFPEGFEEEITLSQYLADRDAANDPEWSETLNDERCALIEKEYRDHLKPKEAARLEALQNQQSAWAARHSTRDFARLDRELAELRGLPDDDEMQEHQPITPSH